MKRTLTFYSVLFFISLILQRGSGIIIKIILANSISPYDYGLITFVALALPSMFQIIVNLNFYNILSHSEEGKKYFGFTLIFTIFLLFLISTVLFIFRDSFFTYLNLPQDGWNLYYIVIVTSLIFISIMTDFQGLYTGLKLYALPGLLVILPTIVRLIIILYLIYSGAASFIAILLVFTLSNAVPLLFIFMSKRLRAHLSLVRSIEIPTKEIFFFGSAVFITGSFASIGQYIVKIVLSHELGVLWQGYYDVSLTLASLIMFTMGTISYISIPEATNSNKDGIFRAGGLGDVTRAFFAFSIFLVILLYFYSDYIVVVLFSENYLSGAKYVFVLAIGFIFLYIQAFLANLNLSFAKEVRDYLRLGSIPIVLLPLFFFLPKFMIEYFHDLGYDNGFIGAYISYTGILILLTLLTIISSKDLSPLRILFYKIDRMIASAIITCVIIYYFNPSPITGMILAAFVFTGLAIGTGYINKKMLFEIFSSPEK